MPLFVSGYIAILDTVKSGFKEVMLKHLWEVMADAATFMCGSSYMPTMQSDSN